MKTVECFFGVQASTLSVVVYAGEMGLSRCNYIYKKVKVFNQPFISKQLWIAPQVNIPVDVILQWIIQLFTDTHVFLHYAEYA